MMATGCVLMVAKEAVLLVYELVCELGDAGNICPFKIVCPLVSSSFMN